MPVIRFEMADSAERTQIGEGLVRFAVQTSRLETGREGGKYFLNHEDGCGVDGEMIRPGDPFFFDTDSGEILCATHGGERREDEEPEDDEEREVDDGSQNDEPQDDASP